MKGLVISTNVSVKLGDKKTAVRQIIFDKNGIKNDIHAGPSSHQISILGQESIDRFNLKTGKEIGPGELGENITISGIDLRFVAILDRIKIGKVILEITRLGKKCTADQTNTENCLLAHECVFARVVRTGKIKPGDVIHYLPYELKISLITLDDRAITGTRTDRATPLTIELIETLFAAKNWHIKIATTLITDNGKKLEKILRKEIDAGTDIIFTIGSTGIGPHDIAPDIVTKICPKLLPSIMDAIKFKSCAKNPAALLSRSTAGFIKKTQIYTLPGSIHAIPEYLSDIFLNLEHLFCVLNSIHHYYDKTAD